MTDPTADEVGLRVAWFGDRRPPDGLTDCDRIETVMVDGPERVQSLVRSGPIDCGCCPVAGSIPTGTATVLDGTEPVVALVEDADDARRAVRAGATDTARLSASPAELSVRLSNAVPGRDQGASDHGPGVRTTRNRTVLDGSVSRTASTGDPDKETASGGTRDRLLDRIQEALLSLDDEGRIVELDRRARELLAPEKADPIGEPFPSLLDGDTATQFRKGIAAATDRGPPVEFGMTLGPDDQRFEASVYPDPVGVSVLLRDVTDRKRLERRLETATERLERIVERIDEAFFGLDEEWRFTYVSERTAEMVGRDAEELIGANLWEEFPVAARMSFYDEANRALEAQESVEFEEYYPPLSVWFSVSLSPDSDGLSVFLRDVTDRVRQEHRVRRLLEATRDLMAGETPRAVMAATAEAAGDVLDFPGTAFRRYDPDAEALVSVALGATVEDIQDRPTYDVEDSPHGRAFRTGETVVETPHEDDPYGREPFTETMYVPVGDHGVLSVGLTE